MTAEPGAEFALIGAHFAGLGAAREDVLLGVGDDCALLRVPPGQSLAVSLDTLVAGVHFFPDCDPHALGHKTLAVSLSDLAAMGAEPAWATLALTLPASDPAWLAAFAAGLGELARAHGVRLVGGDTTRGPLTITLQLQGLVPPEAALRRDGACAGDRIWVSGTLGDAALALAELQAGRDPDAALRARLERPTPRVALGRGLRGIASAAIDLSDGLVADLGHVLAASGVGAELRLGALPLGEAVAARADWSLALAGGDDYELCFCAPPGRDGEILALGQRLGCRLTPIGTIRGDDDTLRCLLPDGTVLNPTRRGYDHFAGA
ncbi:thiamine-phosphate kinase [Marichromatium gracile]|uniref:thiamine-phosphate kinase n=1 Tax=Marichromatium gracile TaxID=1048 RepID=UPI0009ED79BC|nr:thiamine-phosphate kinase [Marichromatium gracile]